MSHLLFSALNTAYQICHACVDNVVTCIYMTYCILEDNARGHDNNKTT